MGSHPADFAKSNRAVAKPTKIGLDWSSGTGTGTGTGWSRGGERRLRTSQRTAGYQQLKQFYDWG